MWICHYFSCPTHLGAKIETRKGGGEYKSFQLEQFIYQFQYFWGCRIWICHYFSCPTHLGAKIKPRKGEGGVKIQSFQLEQFIYQFLYFWRCRIWTCHYFSCPTHLGAKIEPRRGRGVKLKVFDWNNSYINFNILGDAKSKSDIIFHVRTTWGPKLGPKNGIKFEVFIHQFQYFWGCGNQICHCFSYPPHLGAKWSSKRG